jgi:hypothetical protein
MSVETDTGSASREQEAETLQLVSAPVSDRCSACGTQLASDQRYCVNCGERRGKARFPVTSAVPGATERVETAATTTRAPMRHRMSSGGTLIAGIGVLLLAMLVGLLIGKESTPPARTDASAPVQVVTVGGGGGAATTAAAASAPPTKAPKAVTVSQGKGKPPVFKKVVVTKKALDAGNKGLSQVVPTQNLAPDTVTTTGQPCAHGAGCQNGQFTGVFFGQ